MQKFINDELFLKIIGSLTINYSDFFKEIQPKSNRNFLIKFKYRANFKTDCGKFILIKKLICKKLSNLWLIVTISQYFPSKKMPSLSLQQVPRVSSFSTNSSSSPYVDYWQNSPFFHLKNSNINC